MPKVSDEHRAARRGAIIDAAMRVFLRNGYSRTSMADIITESGLSAGAIYGYFDGKQALVHAVAERVLGARIAEVRELSGMDAPHPSTVMRAVLEGVRNEPFSGVVVQLWAEAAADDHLRAGLTRVFSELRATLVSVVTAWGEAHPEVIPSGVEDWSRRVGMVIAGLGPGFLLFRSLLEDFDEEAYLSGIALALGIEPVTLAGDPQSS